MLVKHRSTSMAWQRLGQEHLEVLLVAFDVLAANGHQFVHIKSIRTRVIIAWCSCMHHCIIIFLFSQVHDYSEARTIHSNSIRVLSTIWDLLAVSCCHCNDCIGSLPTRRSFFRLSPPGWMLLICLTSFGHLTMKPGVSLQDYRY